MLALTEHSRNCMDEIGLMGLSSYPDDIRMTSPEKKEKYLLHMFIHVSEYSIYICDSSC